MNGISDPVLHRLNRMDEDLPIENSVTALEGLAGARRVPDVSGARSSR